MTYAVAGVGFVVSVLLILIVMQKTGVCKKKSIDKKKQTVNKPDDELTNQTHLRNNQTNLEPSSHQQPNNLYLDSVYYELDECVAPIEFPTYSNAKTSTESDTDQLKLTYLNSLETKQEYLNSKFVECCKQEHIV